MGRVVGRGGDAVAPVVDTVGRGTPAGAVVADVPLVAPLDIVAEGAADTPEVVPVGPEDVGDVVRVEAAPAVPAVVDMTRLVLPVGNDVDIPAAGCV